VKSRKTEGEYAVLSGKAALADIPKGISPELVDPPLRSAMLPIALAEFRYTTLVLQPEIVMFAVAGLAAGSGRSRRGADDGGARPASGAGARCLAR